MRLPQLALCPAPLRSAVCKGGSSGRARPAAYWRCPAAPAAVPRESAAGCLPCNNNPDTVSDAVLLVSAWAFPRRHQWVEGTDCQPLGSASELAQGTG